MSFPKCWCNSCLALMYPFFGSMCRQFLTSTFGCPSVYCSRKINLSRLLVVLPSMQCSKVRIEVMYCRGSPLKTKISFGGRVESRCSLTLTLIKHFCYFILFLHYFQKISIFTCLVMSMLVVCYWFLL